MAITQGTETLEITTIDRIWRTNTETAYGADPVITVEREIVRIDAKGNVISQKKIGSSTIDPENHTDIVAKIEIAGDTQRIVDIAAEAKTAETTEAAVSVEKQ